MKISITLTELVSILESRRFKSTFKGRPERPVFSFREGFVERDGIKFGQYKLVEQADIFRILFYDTDLGLFTDFYKNIVIIVSGDDRFPISLAFSSGFDDIILEAEETNVNEI